MHPKAYPALWAGFVTPIVMLLVAINFHGLTQDQGALIVAAIGAVGGVIMTLLTRPIMPAAFTTAVTAIFALLAGFHFDVSPDVIAAVTGIVMALLSFFTHTNASPAVPVATPGAAGAHAR